MARHSFTGVSNEIMARTGVLYVLCIRSIIVVRRHTSSSNIHPVVRCACACVAALSILIRASSFVLFDVALCSSQKTDSAQVGRMQHVFD
jgi:hypothetical protein